MNEQNGKQHMQRGFTLLIAVLVVGIILAIGLSILNITLKEYILSGIARESMIALNAADAGMECAFYWDYSRDDGNRFDLDPSGPTITCMGETKTVGDAPPVATQYAQTFDFEWGDPAVCAKVTVTKYYTASAPPVDMGGSATCPVGVECTRVESRGYNRGCAPATLASPRTVERALRARY